jgi:hypothetical protein
LFCYTFASVDSERLRGKWKIEKWIWKMVAKHRVDGGHAGAKEEPF